MKRLVHLMRLLVIGGIFAQAVAQQGPQKPSSFLDPDHDVYFIELLDSIVEYTLGDAGDSSRLNLWIYEREGYPVVLKSYHYTWLSETHTYRLNERYENSYTVDGVPLLHAHYYYSWALDQWRGCDSEGCGKKYWEYDDQGNEIVRGQAYWDKNSRNWKRELEYRYAWDDHHNKVRTEQYGYDQYTGKWQGSSKWEHSYTADNKVWGYVDYLWDPSIDDWMARNKSVSYYPDAFTMCSDYFTWTGAVTGWELGGFEKIEIIPESLNEPEVTIRQYRYLDEENWRNSTRIEHSYDKNGNCLLMTYQMWDGVNNVWMNTNREVRTFNDRNQILTEEYYRWDKQKNRWLGGHPFISGPGKTIYTYDVFGNLMTYTHFEWDMGQDVWVGHDNYRIELSRNTDGQVSEELQYDWDPEENEGFAARKIVLNYLPDGRPDYQTKWAWENDLKEWRPVVRYFFFYAQTSQVRHVDENAMTVFPNPADDLIRVDGLSQPVLFELFNLQGQLVLQKQATDNQLDVSALPAGVYWLVLYQHFKVNRTKVVIY